jgi:ribosomal protein L11 methyltransferase
LWETCTAIALVEQQTAPAILLAAAAKRAGLEQIPLYSCEAVAEQDWVRLTQSQFEPIPISPRLWIVPSWHQAPDPVALNIRLDPGLAFGTGSHPTTRLCLRWLDEHIAGRESVLDYGCGSGILAIAASKLGAGKVWGVDIDPQAVESARHNGVQNNVDASFYLPEHAPRQQADILVANILTNPLKAMAPLLTGLVRPGGRIVLSGILDSQAKEVQAVYSAGFEFELPAQDEGWCRLAGTKR